MTLIHPLSTLLEGWTITLLPLWQAEYIIQTRGCPRVGRTEGRTDHPVKGRTVKKFYI